MTTPVKPAAQTESALANLRQSFDERLWCFKASLQQLASNQPFVALPNWVAK